MYIELYVIGIAVEWDFVMADDLAKGGEVENEEDGAKDWPLGDTASNWVWIWFGVAQGDVFCPVCEVWSEPTEGSVI